MNKRQKQVQKSLLKDELEVLKNIERAYKDSIADIDKFIHELLSRKDVENLQSIIYQVKYQKHIKDELTEMLDVLHKKNYDTIDEYLNECYKNAHIGTLYDLQGQGVPLILPLDQEQMVSAVTLNSKLSAPLYNSLGYNVEILKVDVARELSRGVAQSLSYQEIARNIQHTTDIDKNKAMRIARTEGHRISQEATYNVQVRAKERGADIVKQWDSTLDSRTRDSHRKLDGEIRELDEKFSNGLMYPSDPNGTAGEVINCRCALLQRAKWNLTDGEFKKQARVNGKNELQHFENIADYNKFKEAFWGVKY